MVKKLIFVFIFHTCWGFSQTRQYDAIAFHGFKDQNVSTLYFSPFSTDIYAGVTSNEQTKLFISKDSGSSWTELNQGKPLCADCGVISSISLTEGNYIFAGTTKGGLYSSKDAGKSFSKMKSAPYSSIYSILDNQAGKILISTEKGVMLSENKGKKWSSPHEPDLGAILQNAKLVLHPDSKHIVYALTLEDGVYKTIDAGVNWKQVLKRDKVQFKDIDFVENEIFAVGTDGSSNFLYATMIGDKKWKDYKLDVTSPVVSMEIVETFKDYFFLFGTKDDGWYKSYAIEHALQGFRCIDMEENEIAGESKVTANDNRLYRYNSVDGLKIIEREEECEVMIQPILHLSKTQEKTWGLNSNCELNYFNFRLYDKWGQLILDEEGDINTINDLLKQKVGELAKEQHIYWIKFTFANNTDKLDIKGHLLIKD